MSDFVQAVLGQGIIRREFQRLLKVMARFAIQFLGGINTPKIVVGVVVRLVAAGLQRALKPRNSFVVFALLNQVRTDIVVGVAKFRVDLDGLFALGNGIVNLSLEAVGPTQEREGFGSGVQI